MDRDELLHDLRVNFPIVNTILSAILGIAGLLISLDLKPAIYAVLLAIIGTFLICILVFWYVRRVSYLRHQQSFSVIDSIDVWRIIDSKGKNATHIRQLKFRVNKTASEFLHYPSEVSGKQKIIKAFQLNNNNMSYDISSRNLSGRPVIGIALGRQLEKKEIIDGLCIEWQELDSFINDHESVRVKSEPGQKNLEIRVILPHNCELVSSEWFVTPGNNPIPKSRGQPQVEARDDGHHIYYNFSQHLDTLGELGCAIDWRWKPS